MALSAHIRNSLLFINYILILSWNWTAPIEYLPTELFSEWDILNIRRKSLIGSRRVTTNSGVRWTQIAHHPLPNQVFHWKRFFSRWQVEKTTTVVIIAKRPNPITWSAHYYHAMFLKSLSVSWPMCLKYKTDLFPNVNNDSIIMEALTSAAEH